jgi:hypothetical protein
MCVLKVQEVACLQFWKFLRLPNQHLMITDAFTSHDHNP